MLEAKDGEDALTILDGYQGALDLLLTDVKDARAERRRGLRLRP